MKKPFIVRNASVLVAMVVFTANAAEKIPHQTWTDPASALREDPDFAIQGEYRSGGTESATGAQVVALGNGRFDVYILDGGLPGAGWEPGKARTLMKGERKGGRIECADDAGKTTVTIEKGRLDLTAADGVKRRLSRVERKSPTAGARPPENAVVLFDGTSAEQWKNGKAEGGHLLAEGCTSKRSFGDYTLHLEFRTPYTPGARGQQRGNSGVYHGGRWETQILDSFGLDGMDNECGGIYSISKPRLNMCLPPLVWQTYDVDFKAARFDASGKRTAWPRITVRLNGVPVHENLELARDFTTAAPLSKPMDGPEGPVFLQNHGNPVVFRNIWIVPGS
jgi:hypothetical protein